jgi:dolichol-phosphate mannosyltransferase
VRLATDGIFNFSTVPLTGVFLMGVFMAGMSFTTLMLILALRIFDIPIFGMRAADVQGFSTTILTILLIGGIQLVSTGVLGEYIGRIYHEIKGRPPYVIRQMAVKPNPVITSAPPTSARSARTEARSPD